MTRTYRADTGRIESIAAQTLAFGARRNPDDYSAFTATAIANFDTTRTTDSFTSHESLDPVGLVHMNGRVYAPKLGRFLSADPFVQEPSDTQSLNRMSYVFNGPTSDVDPSGYYGFGHIMRSPGFKEVTYVAAVVASVIACDGGGTAMCYNIIVGSLLSTAGANVPAVGRVLTAFGYAQLTASALSSWQSGLSDVMYAIASTQEISSAGTVGIDSNVFGNAAVAAHAFQQTISAANDFSAGVIDTATFGQRDRIYRALGADPDLIDRTSVAYQLGQYALLATGAYGIADLAVAATLSRIAIAEALTVDAAVSISAARGADESERDSVFAGLHKGRLPRPNIRSD